MIKTTDSLDDGRVTFREPEAETQTETSAVDPVCGKQIDPAGADTQQVVRGGVVYFFCSTSCRDLFLSSPREYGVSDLA